MSGVKRFSRGLVTGGSAGAFALLAGAVNVHAAEQVTIAEVIVTAQKRSEALIDVPLSISVVDGGALERQQAANFQDYLKLVPGLQLNQDTPGGGRLVMRGVNTGSVSATVAVYVDETPFGSSTGLVNGGVLAADFDPFDMQRIEILRGPQGTLYGGRRRRLFRRRHAQRASLRRLRHPGHRLLPRAVRLRRLDRHRRFGCRAGHQ